MITQNDNVILTVLCMAGTLILFSVTNEIHKLATRLRKQEDENYRLRLLMADLRAENMRLKNKSDFVYEIPMKNFPVK